MTKKTLPLPPLVNVGAGADSTLLARVPLLDADQPEFEPLVVLSLGAGVQSSVLALMATVGEISPPPVAAVFADTEDEPKKVYEWLAWLETQLSFPVARVGAGSLSADALRLQVNQTTGHPYYSNRIPAFVKSRDKTDAGSLDRHCTRDFKIRPIQKYVRSLIPNERFRLWRKKHRSALRALAEHERIRREVNRLRAKAKKEREIAKQDELIAEATALNQTTGFPGGAWKEVQDDALVVQYIGISRDETVRMKPSRIPYIRNEWPLIFQRPMRRANCIVWFKAHYEGQVIPFASPPRSACRYCPYKSNAEWRRLRAEEPEEFELAAVFEEQLQEFHRSTADLSSKRTGKSGRAISGLVLGIPYLHRSLVPLREADFSPERDQDDLFGGADQFANECEGMCGV